MFTGEAPVYLAIKERKKLNLRPMTIILLSIACALVFGVLGAILAHFRNKDIVVGFGTGFISFVFLFFFMLIAYAVTALTPQ